MEVDHGTKRVRWGQQPVHRPGRQDHAGRLADRAVPRGDKLIDIVLRQPLDERNAITDIGSAYLPTASGKSIPLTQIAKPVFTWGARCDVAREPRLRHHGAGDVTEGMQGATVTAALLPGLREIEARWHAAGAGRLSH